LALIPGLARVISQRIMTRHCEKCGAEIAEGWTVCRSCYEPVKREGVLTRLLRFLGARVSLEKSSSVAGTRVSISLSERIKTRDPQTGEMRECLSLDEFPVEEREKILQQVRQAALTGKAANVIILKDATGKVQTYQSIEEMPPELRALYEKARGEGLVK
jgi:hypothetical protein